MFPCRMNFRDTIYVTELTSYLQQVVAICTFRKGLYFANRLFDKPMSADE